MYCHDSLFGLVAVFLDVRVKDFDGLDTVIVMVATYLEILELL